MTTIKIILFIIIPALVFLFVVKWAYNNWKRANRTLELDRKAEEAKRQEHDRISRMNARKSTFNKFRK